MEEEAYLGELDRITREEPLEFSTEEAKELNSILASKVMKKALAHLAEMIDGAKNAVILCDFASPEGISKATAHKARALGIMAAISALCDLATVNEEEHEDAT